MSKRATSSHRIPAGTGTATAPRARWTGISSRIERADVIGSALAVLGSLLAATFSLQLWNAHLHVPFVYGSDGLLTQMLVKQVVNGGWVWTNHSVGAPFGLQLYDFPVATDDLNFLSMKVIGLLTSDSGKVMNVYFLLTFPAEALTAYAVLRWLGASVPSSVICAVLFADSPYHLLRGETHLLLSNYVSVPFATYMVVSILDDRRLWLGQLRPFRFASLICWRNLFILVLCVIVGSLGIYYAVFTVLLVGASGIASSVRRRGWGPFVQAAAIIAVIGGVSFLNDVPALVYRHDHGANLVVAQRLPQESEIYALKLIEMAFPVPGHRIGPLARLRYKYDTTNPVPSEDGQQTLGIVSTIGLAWLFLLALGSIVGIRLEATWLLRQRQLAFAAVVAFLAGTLGGISALIGYLFSAQIRGWDRISIFIMFFAIATVAIGLDQLGRRFFRQRRALALLGLATIAVIGIYDQSSLEAIPTYRATGVEYGDDAVFVHAIARILPANSAVFQLPYMPFPETPPINAMQDYDPLRAYVHSSDLRWSYPTMAGRPQDWGSQTTSLPASTLLDSLVAAGFSGLWIDRSGYADGGAQIVADIHALVGSAPLSSRDGTFAFFDLRDYAAGVRDRYPAPEIAGLRAATLSPPEITWGNGFYPPDLDGSHWAVNNAEASVDNKSGKPRQVVFFADVRTLDPGRFGLTVDAPDGTVGRFVITDKPRVVEFPFTVPPGTSTVSFASTAPVGYAKNDPRALAVNYGTPTISGQAISPFLPTGVPAATG